MLQVWSGLGKSTEDKQKTEVNKAIVILLLVNFTIACKVSKEQSQEPPLLRSAYWYEHFSKVIQFYKNDVIVLQVSTIISFMINCHTELIQSPLHSGRVIVLREGGSQKQILPNRSFVLPI